MAILENVSTEEGDVLRIKTEIPIVGLISLTQFVDTTVGESLTDYFKKEFRYSIDGGLTFESWIDLSLLNIQSVSITKFDQFIIEYRYIRVGNTPEVDLEFNDILVSGVQEDLPYPSYLKSAFVKFFPVNDLNVFGWALNVLEKLYVKGLILPDYMERGGNQSNLEDQDFITYWNSITHFFAIIVYFSRQFEDFSTNQLLLEQFLLSRDLVLPNDKNITELLYLYQNYVAEYTKRGTSAILDQIENGKPVDGELIRLVGHLFHEELIFSLFQNFEAGWCIGKSSPLWAGTEKISNLVKGYEFTEKVVDLSKYPLLQSGYVSISTDKMNIAGVPNSVYSGVGGTTKKINIDPSQDYEISFRVSQSSISPIITFGCKVWDKDGNEVLPKNIHTLANSNYFFSSQSLKVVNKDYWIRGILFNSSEIDPLKANLKDSLGLGYNLKLPSNSSSIVPIIGVTSDGGACIVKIDNIKVRPRKLNFSRGQIGIHNLLYLMTPNNNTSLTPERIEEFIKENLIPYNSFLKTNWL